MSILVTGFEPFGGSNVNPSAEIVGALQDDPTLQAYVDFVVLPVDIKLAPQRLIEEVQTRSSRCVVSIGEAGGRNLIAIEKLAVNHIEISRRPDNAGNTVAPRQIDVNGAAAFQTTIEAEPIVQMLLENGIPAATSRDMGSHVCNLDTYRLLQHCATMSDPPMVGFVHVPMLPHQVAQRMSGDAGSERRGALASMDLDTQCAAIRLILAHLQRVMSL